MELTLEQIKTIVEGQRRKIDALEERISELEAELAKLKAVEAT